MKPSFGSWLCAAVLFGSISLHGAEGWSQLKFGMSPDEAIEVLGDPLMRTAGGGFELWIYDNHAEVIFYGGPLVGWTTPAIGQAAARATDVWQRTADAPPAKVYVLPRMRPLRRAEPKVGAPGTSTDSTPYYRIGR